MFIAFEDFNNSLEVPSAITVCSPKNITSVGYIK